MPALRHIQFVTLFFLLPISLSSARADYIGSVNVVSPNAGIQSAGTEILGGGGGGGHMMIWKSGADGDRQLVTCFDFNSAAGLS